MMLHDQVRPLERMPALFESQAAKGDPKTLTPGPWIPLRTLSKDCLMDRSVDYPYGPPLRTTPKQHRIKKKKKEKKNNNWNFVYTGCLDRPLVSAKSKPLRSANQANYKAQVLPFLSLLTGVLQKRLIVEYLSSFRHFVRNREIVKPGASS